MLEDVKIEEYIDHEPTNFPAHAGNSASPDAPQNGWPGRGEHHASPAASDGTEPLGRTSRAIADTLADIAAGSTSGEFPTIESIAKREPSASILKRGRSAASTGAASDRQNAHKGFATAPHRRLIADIRPPMRERVAILEHEQADTEDDIAEIRGMLGKFATHREMALADTDLRTSVNNAHLRIDRDVLPELKALRNSQNVKLLIAIVGLLISMAANIIQLYRNIINP